MVKRLASLEVVARSDGEPVRENGGKSEASKSEFDLNYGLPRRPYRKRLHHWDMARQRCP